MNQQLKHPTQDKQGNIQYQRDPYPRASFDKVHAEKKCTFKKNDWTKCRGTMQLMSVAASGGLHERWFCNTCSTCEAINATDYTNVINVKAPKRGRRVLK